MRPQLDSSKRNGKTKRKVFDSFEYVFNDFLELKAEVNPERAESLKTYLLSKGEKDLTLAAVEGFRINGELVLIDKEPLKEPRRIVFFNPAKGSFRVKKIPSLNRTASGTGGKPVIRVSAKGYTAIIDRQGRIRKRSKLGKPEILFGEI